MVGSLLRWVLGIGGALVLAINLFNDNGPFPLFKPKGAAPTSQTQSDSSRVVFPNTPTVAQAAKAPTVAPADTRAGPATTPANVRAQPVAPARPGPEDIVVFPNSNIVCFERDDLKQVVLSGVRGEETKIKALVPGPGQKDAPCFMVPPTKRLKVLSANYPDANDSLGLLEVVGEGVTSRDGAWTLSLGAEVVKSRRSR